MSAPDGYAYRGRSDAEAATLVWIVAVGVDGDG